MNILYKILSILISLMVVVLSGCGENDTPNQASSSQSTLPAKVLTSDADTLPLLPIMIQLEQNIIALQSGIWREDYDTIQRAAQAIAEHPKIDKNQIETIRSILGEETFKLFVQDDKKVHQTSVAAAKAAEQQDLDAVVNHTQALFQGCASCHQNHRQTIRESAKWSITQNATNQ